MGVPLGFRMADEGKFGLFGQCQDMSGWPGCYAGVEDLNKKENRLLDWPGSCLGGASKWFLSTQLNIKALTFTKGKLAKITLSAMDSNHIKWLEKSEKLKFDFFSSLHGVREREIEEIFFEVIEGHICCLLVCREKKQKIIQPKLESTSKM